MNMIKKMKEFLYKPKIWKGHSLFIMAPLAFINTTYDMLKKYLATHRLVSWKSQSWKVTYNHGQSFQWLEYKHKRDDNNHHAHFLHIVLQYSSKIYNLQFSNFLLWTVTKIVDRYKLTINFAHLGAAYIESHVKAGNISSHIINTWNQL